VVHPATPKKKFALTCEQIVFFSLQILITCIQSRKSRATFFYAFN
jgi:hypothetical protein